MGSVIQIVLGLITRLLPLLGGNSQVIADIITALIQIMPVLVKEYQDIMPEIKNIITALTTDSAVTPDQIAQLRALSKIADTDFDNAVAAAEAEDLAAALAEGKIVAPVSDELDTALKS